MPAVAAEGLEASLAPSSLTPPVGGVGAGSFLVFSLLAFLQGWSSTAWLLFAEALSPRIGGPFLAVGLGHSLAFVLLVVLALGQRQESGWPGFRTAAARVPRKLAFVSGLGWSTTLGMVMAGPVVGVALVQVLTLSGELLTASLVGVCMERNSILLTALACTLVLLGVLCSCLGDMTSSEITLQELLPWTLVTFCSGVGLVLNSLGNTHLRQGLGPRWASAVSALVASLGDFVVFALSGVHFKLQAEVGTIILALGIAASSAYFVFVSAYVPDRIGFPFTFVLATAGKMIAGLAVDVSGISGVVRPMRLEKSLGVLAVLTGAFLMKLPTPCRR